ncbi:MAG: transposase [Gemmatimonadales bacterium]|nr:transposase [Gemmatimonadales bacterium]
MGTQQRHTAEQISVQLREADVELGRGVPVGQICRTLEMSEHTYYRWRRAYGGLKVDQATRFKELEAEHARLKRLVAEQALDNAILREAAKGNF